MAGRRAQQKQETRDSLYDTAMRLFEQRGYHAVNIDDIVRVSGVARGTFYLHFPTKDHVLMELMRRKQDAIVQRLGTVRSAAAKPFLRRVVDLMLEDANKEEPAMWHELFAVIGRHAPEMRTEGSSCAPVK